MNTESEPKHIDRSHIHVNNRWELNRWCEELNLRADELKEIVKKVGNNVQAVREYVVRRNLLREDPYGQRH